MARTATQQSNYSFEVETANIDVYNVVVMATDTNISPSLLLSSLFVSNTSTSATTLVLQLFPTVVSSGSSLNYIH